MYHHLPDDVSIHEVDKFEVLLTQYVQGKIEAKDMTAEERRVLCHFMDSKQATLEEVVAIFDEA